MCTAEREALIKAVEAHPCLWNHDDDNFSSTYAKTKAWDQIVSLLDKEYEGLSAGEKFLKRDVVKRRWHNIKDFYRKYCIKIIQGKAKTKSTYAKHLGFLDPVLNLNRLRKKFSAPGTYSDDSLDKSYDDDNTPEGEAKKLIRKFTMKDIAKLLGLIEKHPSFWSKGSYCKGTRDQDLETIAAAMEPKYEEFTEAQQTAYRLALHHKWLNIRDTYRRNMKALAAGLHVKPYMYLKNLEFLDSVYNYERNIDDTADASNADNCIDTNDVGHDDNDGNADCNDDADSNGEPSDWTKKLFVDVNNIEPKAKKMKLDKETENLRSSLSSTVNTSMNFEDDATMSFFKSILPDVNALSPAAKMDFKIKVLKILKGLQKIDDVLSSASLKVEEESDNSDL